MGSDCVLVFGETDLGDLLSVSGQSVEVVAVVVVVRIGQENGRLVLRRRSDKRDECCEEDGEHE